MSIIKCILNNALLLWNLILRTNARAAARVELLFLFIRFYIYTITVLCATKGLIIETVLQINYMVSLIPKAQS